MGLVIYGNNQKNYVLKKDKNNDDKIDLITLHKDDEVVEKKIKPKLTKSKKKITKENQDYLNSLKIGNGFKIIPKISN